MSERTEWLKRCVSMLASDPTVQIEYIRSFDFHIDELALEFDDVSHVTGSMLSDSELNSIQYDGVKKLDNLLDEMSGKANAELWTEEGLHSAPEWREVRRQAKELLVLLQGQQDPE